MSPADLLESLGTIGDTPEGIERMRQLILQIAVRGRLVPQNLTDEPASDLLKKIAQSRDELVRLHGLRKQPVLEDVKVNDCPWEPPSGWLWTNIGNVTASCSGGTPSRSRSEFYSGSIPWAKSGELGDGYVTKTSEAITQEALDSSSAKLLPIGNVCIALYGATVGRVGILAIEACTNQAVCSLFPPDGLDRLFLFWYLRAIRPQLIGQSQGGAQPNISNGLVRQTLLPLPPLAEQHRIVAKVDELMALLDELEQARDERDAHRTAFRDSALSALQNAEDSEAVEAAWSRIATNLADCITDPADIAPLRQTILQLAVRGRLVPQDPNDEPASELLKAIEEEKAELVLGKKIQKPKPLPPVTQDIEPFSLPEGWSWTRMDWLHSKLGAGSTPLGGKNVYTDDGVPFLRSQNVRNDGLYLDNVARIPAEIHEKMSYTHVQEGDVLLNITGASIARSCVVHDVFDAANVSQHVAIVRQIQKKTNRWVHLFLISPLGYESIMSVQVGVSREGLSMRRLREFLVPLPPIAEQLRIAVKVDELMAVCDELEQQLTEAKTHQSAFAAAAVHHLDLAQETQPV